MKEKESGGGIDGIQKRQQEYLSYTIYVSAGKMWTPSVERISRDHADWQAEAVWGIGWCGGDERESVLLEETLGCMR